MFFAKTDMDFANVLPHFEAGVETGFCLRCVVALWCCVCELSVMSPAAATGSRAIRTTAAPTMLHSSRTC